MSTPRRPYANSIDSLGFAKFLDSKYADRGGYAKFEEMIHAGASDGQIATAFSSEHLPLSKNAAGYWRKRWQEEQNQ